MLLPTRLDDAAQFAESLREGVEQLGATHGEARVHVSISIGVALARHGRAASSCIRSRRPRPPARPPRIAAAIASRSTRPNDLSIVRRFADINIAAQPARGDRREDRLRLDAQLIAPLAAAPNVRGRTTSCCCA